MTKNEFEIFWTLNYPESIPLPHLFKEIYSDRWFRIHYLPESKRYADDEKEMNIILMRQNEVVTELFGCDAQLFLVTGEYNWGERTIFITDEEEVFKPYHFTRLDNIDLFKYNPNDYDEHEIYRPAFAETNWIPNQHDNLLRVIANWQASAFFISRNKNIIVAPYDGGVDIILKDKPTRDFYKEKYKKWLSPREDGL